MGAQVYEITRYREKRHIFRDRFEAGETLGRMLKPDYENIEDGVILAIPCGGVPVGIKIEQQLYLPFDLQIVRKLQIPGNPEAGFGAMTLGGSVFFNEPLLAELHLSPSQIEAEKKRVATELARRNTLFRGGRPHPDLKAKRVLLVDDGLASGFTMLASVDAVRKAGARETVVAVPTAPQRTVERLAAAVDNIYCANIRSTRFFAVADAYRKWYDLSEEEVIEMLEEMT